MVGGGRGQDDEIQPGADRATGPAQRKKTDAVIFYLYLHAINKNID